VQNGNTFNLISASWLPVIRASGRRDRIQPARLTDDIDADPVVDLDFPRADFRCAALEFLIGLLTVACPPSDDWADRWTRPPSKGELEAAFSPFATAFTFDGEGPRAFQDLEDFSTEPTPVEALLIEAPGAETKRKNRALLVKSGRIKVLSRPAAAAALLTLQTMAPEGGRGNLTSLRGGGPLTTLVVPTHPVTLWHKLWANVPLAEEAPTPNDFPLIFPWLAPTRTWTNANCEVTTPENVDWRQAFFGMPRRIRLDFELNTERLPCDLTGEVDDVIVRTWRGRPNGTKYEAWGGRHPLTPYYRSNTNDQILLPFHLKIGRVGYREWAAVLYGTKDGLCIPAASVSLFLSQRKDDLPRNQRFVRLMAAGYVMKSMKALAFFEGETPEISISHASAEIAQKAKDLVAAAKNVARALGQAVKIALYGEGTKIGASTTPLTTARDRFWADTNDDFFAILNDFSVLNAEDIAGDAAAPIARKWRAVMERAALSIFDDMAPVHDVLSPDVKRVVDGRRFLVLTLLGYGTDGVELFKCLQLPVPETKARKGKAA
jgi:CRISPR system Cascade subunit CasA